MVLIGGVGAVFLSVWSLLIGLLPHQLGQRHVVDIIDIVGSERFGGLSFHRPMVFGVCV